MIVLSLFLTCKAVSASFTLNKRGHIVYSLIGTLCRMALENFKRLESYFLWMLVIIIILLSAILTIFWHKCGVFLPHSVSCTAQLMHHYFLRLCLETAPYPIFGPLRGPRAHLLSIFHVYYSYFFYLPISPVLVQYLTIGLTHSHSLLMDVWLFMCMIPSHNVHTIIANAMIITPSHALLIYCVSPFFSLMDNVSHLLTNIVILLRYSNSTISCK